MPCSARALLTEPPRAPRIAVESRALMRVFAVAQILLFVEVQRQLIGEVLIGIILPLLQVAGDHGVVARRVRERLGRQTRARVDRGVPGSVDLRQHAGIVGRVDQHGDVGVVLGRGAQHGRAADVDVLDRLGIAAIGPRDGGGERIEIDDQQIDGIDAVLAHQHHRRCRAGRAGRRARADAAS